MSKKPYHSPRIDNDTPYMEGLYQRMISNMNGFEDIGAEPYGFSDENDVYPEMDAFELLQLYRLGIKHMIKLMEGGDD